MMMTMTTTTATEHLICIELPRRGNSRAQKRAKGNDRQQTRALGLLGTSREEPRRGGSGSTRVVGLLLRGSSGPAGPGPGIQPRDPPLLRSVASMADIMLLTLLTRAGAAGASVGIGQCGRDGSWVA